MNADEMVSDAIEATEPGTEDFEAAVEAEFAADSEQAEAATPAEQEEVPEETPSPEVSEEVEEPQAEGAVAPPPPEEPAYVEIEGVQVPAEKAKALADFWLWSQGEGQSWLYTLNELQQRGIDPRTLLEGPPTRPEPTPPPETFAAPQEEYVDPSVAAAVQRELAPLKAEIEQYRAQQDQQAQANVAAIANTAMERFASDHQMSNAEARDLLYHAGNTVNFLGFVQDPTTGQRRDQVSAICAAMESAMWSLPAYKQKELDRITSEAKDTQKRSRKLAAVGGTSGSVPQKPVPTSPADREEWAVEQISEAMGLAK